MPARPPVSLLVCLSVPLSPPVFLLMKKKKSFVLLLTNLLLYSVTSAVSEQHYPPLNVVCHWWLCWPFLRVSLVYFHEENITVVTNDRPFTFHDGKMTCSCCAFSINDGRSSRLLSGSLIVILYIFVAGFTCKTYTTSLYNAVLFVAFKFKFASQSVMDVKFKDDISIFVKVEFWIHYFFCISASLK